MPSPRVSARDALRRHPHWTAAARGALAAGIAWLVVLPFGGLADDYPYFAPLGAVVATSPTVLSSVRGAAWAVAGIVLGAALGLAGVLAPGPGVVALVGVVGIGLLLSTWHRLQPAGTWIPIAGLFVLVLGNNNPEGYVLAYAGLTAVGALVGVLLNLAMPQLALTPTVHLLARLRHELVAQLDSIADALQSQETLGDERWRSMAAGSFAQRRAELDALVTEIREARRGNWRARRWQETTDRAVARATALETIARLVEEIGDLMADDGNPVHRDGDEPRALGEDIASALRAAARVLAEDDEDAMPGRVAAARDALRALRRTALSGDSYPEDERLTGATVAVTLHRALARWV